MTTTEVAPEQADAAGTVLGQLMGDFAATAGVVMTALGRRLGLWDALAAGPAQAGAVAERAGAALPYVREWLCSQAAAGYVSYDPAAQTFGLAPGVAAVLGDGPLAGLADGMAAQFAVWWSQLDCYEAAFRTGEGLAWGAFPAAHAEGMDMITRAVVIPALVGQWLPASDGIVDRLSAGATVADVGCGYGAACLALAEAFPASRFTGFDIDDASVARARRAGRRDRRRGADRPAAEQRPGPDRRSGQRGRGRGRLRPADPAPRAAARTGRTVARLRQRLTASHRPGPAPGRAGLRWAQIRIVPSARMVQPGLWATSQT